MPGETKIAVVLNGTARNVTQSVINEVRRQLTNEKLYISNSLEHSKKIAKKIIDGRFEVVMCGGGDGTFGRIITDIHSLKPKKMPAFGVLRLGTGNGVAEALGVAPYAQSWTGEVKGIEGELNQAKNPNARINKTILKINETYAPFAGIGMDGVILNDYNAIKTFLDKIPLVPKKNRGTIDYALAITMISFWRYFLSEKMPLFIVRNGNKEAHRIGYHGDPVGTLKPGEILYRGPALVISASTIPYYGWGVRAFPQANSFLMKDFFQLRISSMDILETLFQLPALFFGRLEHPKIWDYACREVTIELLNTSENKKYRKGLHSQESGNPLGKLKKMKIELAKIRAVCGSAFASCEPPK